MPHSRKKKTKILQEFKDFVLRGNALELAVGVVMGTAFHALVTSLVMNILTPLLGVFGSPDFSDLAFRAGRAHVKYGAFINSLISLIMVGSAVFFFVVKPLNRLMNLRKAEPDMKSVKMDCPECLSSVPQAARRCAFCTSPLQQPASPGI